MSIMDPESESWASESWDNFLESQSFEGFSNIYGIHPSNDFICPPGDHAVYSDYSIPGAVVGLMYPMHKPVVYSPPSAQEFIPTDVFQSVPSTSYSTPASFEYPLFDPMDNTRSSAKALPPATLHPLNQVQSSAFASFDSDDSTLVKFDPITHTPSPDEAVVETKHEIAPPPSRKRRHASESSQSDETSARIRRTRIVINPQATAEVRAVGACLYCKRRRTSCKKGYHPDGPCMPCLEMAQKITVIPGLLRPVCWRPPKIKNAEIFRRGPTIDFAASLRGHKTDAKAGKQAVWDLFALGSKGKHEPKVVQLSQHWTSDSLTVELHRYSPMENDKQHYTWHDGGIERHYDTPPYGIGNWRMVLCSIEKFMERNFEQYIDAHLRDATEISRTTFEVALEHRHLPLVDRALKIWVGCRFIEEPWSITGTETLNLSTDPHPSSPYHTRIPVPPIVDLQIDLIVINSILQPRLKETLATMSELLEASAPWKDWFEIYLAYFVLLHNVELTMQHDAWFVRRHNLKTKYSNRPLVETIMQGATTLLTCFHYAHQGYAPFTDPAVERAQQGGWSERQRAYVRVMSELFKGMAGDHVSDPAKELFWTSQLGRDGWRPVVVF